MGFVKGLGNYEKYPDQDYTRVGNINDAKLEHNPSNQYRNYLKIPINNGFEFKNNTNKATHILINYGNWDSKYYAYFMHTYTETIPFIFSTTNNPGCSIEDLIVHQYFTTAFGSKTYGDGENYGCKYISIGIISDPESYIGPNESNKKYYAEYGTSRMISNSGRYYYDDETFVNPNGYSQDDSGDYGNYFKILTDSGIYFLVNWRDSEGTVPIYFSHKFSYSPFVIITPAAVKSENKNNKGFLIDPLLPDRIEFYMYVPPPHNLYIPISQGHIKILALGWYVPD